MQLEFRRKAYDQMLEWKHSMSNRYALLIEGARRVGKTHLIQKFIEREVEVDFLFRNGIKICPVEVKSSGYRVHASLDWLTKHHPSNLGIRYVICTGDYEQAGNITYLPCYMTHCL